MFLELNNSAIYIYDCHVFSCRSCNDEQYNERKEMQEKLLKFMEKLDEVEAAMRTKKTELMHLEADNMRLLQEKQSAKIELDNCSASIRESIYTYVANKILHLY